MSRQANPTLIGVFVLGAIVLGVVTLLLLAGGQWFQERRQHILYFEGSAQGLQVGAPVVFLGVKVGMVKHIQLGLDAENQRFMVPVTIEVTPNMVESSRGERVDLRDRATIRRLVNQGLRARLKVQSLLTGQLYIDVDFYPDKPAHFMARDPKISEIPTIPTAVDELATQLEQFPMDTFLTDLAVISQSLNQILSSEETQMIPAQLTATLANLQSLSATINSESGPLLTEIRADLIEMRTAFETAQTAMIRVSSMAEASSPMLTSLSNASEELARTAQALQGLVGEKSPTVHHLNTALSEITRAARALRFLAETLEQQPEAALQGKRIEEEQQ
ncbi:MAG: MCE family protein [Desulfobulbaceae bacterium]|uniref:MCE family protein n=1 Tax=Candidatus Desulfatifera sulfidica TaxID=2841691 RepID=A0A8J6T9Z4_9BACT|nr:MCE family protein [Candidatus Desulfatifera sulfidica]